MDSSRRVRRCARALGASARRCFAFAVAGSCTTAVLLSCESPVDLDVEEVESIAAPQPPSPPVRLGSFLIQAAAYSGRTEDDNVVAVNATARNATSGPLAVDQLCIAQFRLRDPASGRLLWQDSAVSPSCTFQQPGLRSVAPGMELVFSTPYDFRRARQISDGGEIGEGSYALSILARAGADTAEVPAGRVFLSLDRRPSLLDPRLLRYRTATTIEGSSKPSVVTRVLATNPTDRWIEFGWSDCYMHVHAFRSESRVGPPAWRSDARPIVCAAIYIGYILAPGDTVTREHLTRSIPVSEILGDSLPEGRYWFSAKLGFNSQLPGGLGYAQYPIDLPAGSAVLVRTP